MKCEAGNVNENCPLCEKSLRNCTAPEAVKTDAKTPEEKPKSNMGSLMILLVLALAGGGAALYYFKFHKSKADTTGHDDLHAYDFGEDEDADEEPAEIEIHSEDGDVYKRQRLNCFKGSPRRDTRPGGAGWLYSPYVIAECDR